jgi:hypothetical protein
LRSTSSGTSSVTALSITSRTTGAKSATSERGTLEQQLVVNLQQHLGA